jgi:hypothetical protein
MIFIDKRLSVRFGVLTAVTVKKTVFWDVTPCSLVEVFQSLGRMYCLVQDTLNIEARISEESVNYQTIRRHILEDNYFQTITHTGNHIRLNAQGIVI